MRLAISLPRLLRYNPVILAYGYLIFVCTSCYMSRAEGEGLRKEIVALEAELNTNIQKANQERLRLQKVLEQATLLLTRNSADVGAQVERLQAKVDKLTGAVEEQQTKLNDLSQKFNDFQARVDVKLEGLSRDSAQNTNPPVPENKDELFQQASAKLAAGDHQEARRLLRHFISRYPGESRLDQAQLMLGNSYYTEQKFAPAIVEYKKIVEQYKQSPAVPDALYKIGMSFYQLKFCSDAQLFFSQLLRRYKRYSQASSATRVLKLIQRYKSNRNFCHP